MSSGTLPSRGGRCIYGTMYTTNFSDESGQHPHVRTILEQCGPLNRLQTHTHHRPMCHHRLEKTAGAHPVVHPPHQPVHKVKHQCHAHHPTRPPTNLPRLCHILLHFVVISERLYFAHPSHPCIPLKHLFGPVSVFKNCGAPPSPPRV